MNYVKFGKAFVIIMILAFALGTLTGCSSRAQSAQKLFDRGQYDLVVEKYPDLEIARRAQAKIAEKLLADKKYDEILQKYVETPAAYKARQAQAQELFDQGKYQEFLDKYEKAAPGLAAQAKEKLADSLYAAGKFDDIVARFKDTAKGKQIREERAEKQFADAKKLRGDAKRTALEQIVTNYGDTKVFSDANAMLAKIREADQKKAQKAAAKPKK
jgi:hypothetical protein